MKQRVLPQKESLMNFGSGGNSAAEIHSKNLPTPSLSSSQNMICRKFCGGNPQREFLPV